MLTETVLKKGGVVLNLPVQWTSEDDFYELCRINKTLRFERQGNGEVIVLPPVGLLTSVVGSRLSSQVGQWALKHGGVACSNGGFTLSNSSVKSPCIAWIVKDRWLALPPEDRKKFAPIVPDFVIELMSEHDKLGESQEKMMEWMDNGVRLGWLIDPKQEKVFVYRPESLISIVEGFDKTVSGEEVLVGFELRLERLRV